MSTEAILRTKVDKHFNCKEYCGYESEKPLPVGEYAVVYSSSIDDQAFAELAGDAVLVYTDNVDSKDGMALECVMFIKLEE